MADISIWQKTGHFYFALTSLTAVAYPGLTPARGITPIADHNSTGVRQSQLKSRKKVDSLENDSPGLLKRFAKVTMNCQAGHRRIRGFFYRPTPNDG